MGRIWAHASHPDTRDVPGEAQTSAAWAEKLGRGRKKAAVEQGASSEPSLSAF